MKKILSTLLALVLSLSLATVAFAEEATPTEPSTPTTWNDMETVTLVKEYKLTNAGTTSPAETFSFSDLTCTSVTDAAEGVTTSNALVPSITSVSYSAGEAGGDNAKKNITLTLPTYTSVGIYTYTFTETDGGTAGVTYRSDAITLKVTVIEQNGKVRVAAIHTEAANGEKSNEFVNTYSAGSLAVMKKVEGGLGDTTKKFTVKVTFTAPQGDTVREAISYNDGTAKTIAAGWTGEKEVEIELKSMQTVTFTNIPYGVTYVVGESDYTNEGYNEPVYDDNKEGTIEAASVSTTIINSKPGTPETGVALDSMPYFVILSVACVGMFLLLTKKRATREF